MINELRYQPTSEQDIEVCNRLGKEAVPLGGWQLCITAAQCYVFPELDLEPSDCVVVHWANTGVDSGIDLYTGDRDDLETMATVVLYDSDGPGPAHVVDGLSWDAPGGDHALVPDLVSALQWPGVAESDRIDVASYESGNSLEFYATGDAAYAWGIRQTPGFGE